MAEAIYVYVGPNKSSRQRQTAGMFAPAKKPTDPWSWYKEARKRLRDLPDPKELTTNVTIEVRATHIRFDWLTRGGQPVYLFIDRTKHAFQV